MQNLYSIYNLVDVAEFSTETFHKFMYLQRHLKCLNHLAKHGPYCYEFIYYSTLFFFPMPTKVEGYSVGQETAYSLPNVI